MKNTIYIIAIIFLFACKKEKSEPIKKNDLKGKIKTVSTSPLQKTFFSYNEVSGNLEKISIIADDTTLGYTIKRTNDYIFLVANLNFITYLDSFEIKYNNEGLIKKLFIWNNGISKDYITVSFTNKLNYFSDFEGNISLTGKYDKFTLVNGNYTKYIHKYKSYFTGSDIQRIDNFAITYTTLPYNKYAPYQKLLLEDGGLLDYLGYDDNYLFPQNKNLIESIKIDGYWHQKYDFEYEFNSLNQLVKTRISSFQGIEEYTMEYY